MSPLRAYGALLFVFTANDILFWLASGSYAIYAVDYGAKLVMLALLLAAGAQRMADPRPTVPPRPEALAFWLVFAVVANLALFFAAARMERIAPSPHLFDWPKVKDVWLAAIDLTLGLALTAVVEEMMGRRLAWNVLAPRLTQPWGPLVVSSVLFGLGHWGQGPWNTLSATLGGAALFVAYRRTGSLALVVIAHYLVNLIDFGKWYGIAWLDPAFYFR